MVSSSQDTADRINAAAARLEPELVEFTREIVKIPSVTGSEGEVVNHIARRMRGAGFDRVFQDRMGNVVGQLGTGRTKVLFDAHVDTVEPGDLSAWTHDPYKAEVEDGVLYGRGACDDKGPFAAAFYGARIIKELGLEGDFTLYVSGSVGEENGEGVALASLFEETGLEPDAVVVAESSSLTIRRGHRGRALIGMRFGGRAVHASTPEQGINPIYKAAPVIKAIEQLNRELSARAGDPFLGRGSVVATRLLSPAPSFNTIPGEATVMVDRRLTIGETRESILSELRSLPGAGEAAVEIIRLNEPSHTGLVREAEEFFPPWALPAEHPLVVAGVQAYRRVFRSEPTVERWDFSTNGTYTMGIRGIPTIGFGPGDGRYAHTALDQVSVTELVRAAAFFAALPLALTAK